MPLGASNNAQSADTDFGALIVRSNPGARQAFATGRVPFWVDPPSRLATTGCEPNHERPQRHTIHTECGLSPADPPAGHFAGSGVVGVQAFGHLRQLVGLYAGPKFHKYSTPSPRPGATAPGARRRAGTVPTIGNIVWTVPTRCPEPPRTALVAQSLGVAVAVRSRRPFAHRRLASIDLGFLGKHEAPPPIVTTG